MTSFFVAIFGHRSLLAAGEEVYEGLKLHKTGGWHAVVGKGIASVMWCVENVARPHLLLLTSSNKAVSYLCNWTFAYAAGFGFFIAFIMIMIVFW